MSDTPILDLLIDRKKLRDEIIEAARGRVRTHVVNQVVQNVVRPRVDEILSRVRGR
jgi:hypothetical protein